MLMTVGDCGGGPRAGRDEEMDERRKRSREGGGEWREGQRFANKFNN